jgi:hypothetical protein
VTKARQGPALKSGRRTMASPDFVSRRWRKSCGHRSFVSCLSISSPICMNCHTSTDYPRQTEDRRRHLWDAVRGSDDQGADILRCSTCHGDENNSLKGIPGAPGWRLAPVTMAWESAPGVPLSTHDLCARLKDTTRNGNRDLAGLTEHMEHEPLVNWAWNPGVRPNGEDRLTPPLSHEAFVAVFKERAEAGAPCPAY